MCHDKRYHNLPHDCTIALATAAHRDYSRSVTMADKPVTNVMPMDVEKGATTGVGGGNVASSASPVAQRRPCDKLNAWMRFTAYDDGMFTQPTCAPKVPHLLLHRLLSRSHIVVSGRGAVLHPRSCMYPAVSAWRMQSGTPLMCGTTLVGGHGAIRSCT